MLISQLNRWNSPPKIKSIRIIENPFDDIVPRITAAEKRAQQLAKERAQREREEEMRRKGAKKYAYFPFLLKGQPDWEAIHPQGRKAT